MIIAYYIFAYFVIMVVTYGVCEYDDLVVDKDTNEIKEKSKKSDECPNFLIALFWPFALSIVILNGPFELATWMAKKVKKILNPKKVDFNNGKYE